LLSSDIKLKLKAVVIDHHVIIHYIKCSLIKLALLSHHKFVHPPFYYYFFGAEWRVKAFISISFVPSFVKFGPLFQKLKGRYTAW